MIVALRLRLFHIHSSTLKGMRFCFPFKGYCLKYLLVLFTKEARRTFKTRLTLYLLDKYRTRNLKITVKADPE